MGKGYKYDSDKLLPEGLFASQVAQIRAKESKLLSDNDLQKLMQCEPYEDCLRLLRDRGWGSGDDLTAETLLRTERENLWKAMRGMCNEQEMHTFDIFRFPKDYHNFKAAIKEAYVQKEVPNIYLEGGTLPIEKINEVLFKCVKIIGITGPTGSGKSTALKIIEANGGLVLDCDKIYHSLLDSNAEMINELKQRFPDSFSNDKLDRKKLSSIVFNDTLALADLNRITHKYVSSEVKKRIESFAMNGGTLAAIDAVELISSGLNNLCTKTVAVISNKESRLRRIMTRDGISEKSAEVRIASGRNDDYYISNCDTFIENNSTEEDFLNKFSKEVF